MNESFDVFLKEFELNLSRIIQTANTKDSCKQFVFASIAKLSELGLNRSKIRVKIFKILMSVEKANKSFHPELRDDFIVSSWKQDKPDKIYSNQHYATTQFFIELKKLKISGSDSSKFTPEQLPKHIAHYL